MNHLEKTMNYKEVTNTGGMKTSELVKNITDFKFFLKNQSDAIISICQILSTSNTSRTM